MYYRRLLVLSLMAGLGLGVSQAEPAPPADVSAAWELPDVVVTAQKREQNLSDVGLSMTVATGEDLAAAGVSDVTDLPKVTSGFTVAKTYTGYQVFSIRGVNFNASQFSAPPAVSTYLDEVILPYGPMTAGILFDIDHVEVLKGPQGTLFGQNATGGSINVIAAKPTREAQAGVAVDANQFGQVDLQGYLSGPVSDSLRARVAADLSGGGAWQRGYYLVNGGRNGDQAKGAMRLLLDWTPSDALRVNFALNAFYDHSEPQLAQLASVHIVNPVAAYPGLDVYPLPGDARDAETRPGSHYNNRNVHESVRVDWDIAQRLRLTSITSFVDAKFDQPFDPDGTAYDIIYTRSIGTGRSFAQELRLAGSSDDARLNYTVGANFQKDRMRDEHANEHLYHFSTLPPNTNINASYDETNRAAAAFGNVDFAISPYVTLTGGLRYTDLKQTMKGCIADSGDGSAAGLFGGYLANLLRAAYGLPPTNLYVPGGCITIDDTGTPPNFLPALTDVAQTAHNLSWRVGINVKPTERNLVYALVSRAFKAGVFPFQDTVLESQVQPVRQEKLTSYEVGTKLSLLDRRLNLNAALFYYDYIDKQFFTYYPSPLGPSATIVNIPKSTVVGEDVDIAWVPAEGWKIRGAVTHIKTKIGAYQGYDIQLNVVDFTDKRFNFAPEWSGSGDIEYSMPLSGETRMFVGASVLFNSTTYADLGENPGTRLPAHNIYDARLGLEAGRKWRLSLWGRNLGNKYYWNTVAAGGADTDVKYAGLPRTVGVSASYSFW